MSSPNPINNHFLLHAFVKLLPARMKRLMLLASFAAMANDTKESDDQAIRSLNQILQLADSDAALRFPIHVSGLIWTNVSGLQPDMGVLKDNAKPGVELQSSATRIVSTIPEWFSYASKEQMIADILNIFRTMVCQPQFAHRPI
jgi:hypothetical protein